MFIAFSSSPLQVPLLILWRLWVTLRLLAILIIPVDQVWHNRIIIIKVMHDIYVWQKTYYYDSMVHALLHCCENNTGYLFHSSKSFRSVLTFIRSAVLLMFNFFVNSRYLFLQQLYIFIYCPYMLDMCFSKILFKQSWKKRRLYHTQPWFILGVRLCTFISFVQCLTYITHIRVKDNWMLKVAFKMPSIIFRH